MAKTAVHTVYKTPDSGLYESEIKTGFQLGYHSSTRYSWLPCVTCGKLRWARLLGNKPRNPHCKYCGNHQRRGRPGKTVKNSPKGYVLIYLYPEDFFYPMAAKSGYVVEHRLVMAKYLGRLLQPWEFVHHINGVKDDNRIENLKLMMSETHNAITGLQTKVNRLAARVTLLEAENVALRRQLNVNQNKSSYPI